MTHINIRDLIQSLHDHPSSGYFSLAGGGVSGLSLMLSVPGASRTVLGADIPYSEKALTDQLGGLVAGACSEETAAAMAAYAFEKARGLTAAPSSAPFGLSCTAALATDRTRQGQDRAYLALQCAEGFYARSLLFSKAFSREEQESALGEALLHFLASILFETAGPTQFSDVILESNDQSFQAPTTWQALIQCEIQKVESESPVRALLPGAFNPIHQGHQDMAALAAERLGGPVHFELSTTNVDKPPLSYWHLQRRVEALRACGPYVITRAPTFREKAALFPETCFVVGADTLARVDDDKYYASQNDRMEAIAAIAAQGCRFLVFGRMIDGQFQTLQALKVSDSLLALCEGIDEKAFRRDITSSALRAQKD
jgi:nicotinamide mononucleotide (NMN) deamidase PncC